MSVAYCHFFDTIRVSKMRILHSWGLVGCGYLTAFLVSIPFASIYSLRPKTIVLRPGLFWSQNDCLAGLSAWLEN